MYHNTSQLRSLPAQSNSSKSVTTHHCGKDLAEFVDEIYPGCGWDLAEWWMRSSRVVRASLWMRSSRVFDEI
jgi:hypothetical protein